jgi:hypothetical protein
MRPLSIVCGIGLVILWLVGLGSATSAPWLTWLNALGAIMSFVVASSVQTRTAAINTAVGTSIGLFALWIIGLSTDGLAYQNWWTFVFACLMGVAALLGVGETGRGSLGRAPTTVDTETDERFRRSA